ncbi:hypothetical protein MPSI1_003520 [Malassezia psittaci]|uniref:Major facilitator superfamily (MFS) profile domain-containing protein n=1 Tax=Malassezia psittaci TaxID=1821823 RepID=A0AAF0JFX2_9BASI|nr:hypothetical protein MPSI1_003520 [Malassezia psittaci]
MGITARKDPTHGLFHVPNKAERERLRAGAPLNPIKIFAMLSGIQWAWFLCGLFCWIMDSYDFFAVSLSVSKLVVTFYGIPADDKEATAEAVKKVNYAIMLTLLFRSLGAVVFGILSDRFGRRWVLSINMVIVAALSLGTAYADTYSKFLAVRSIFGIGMGGIWGMSTATALENMPTAARGLCSGILQQGYAMGYLIAAAVNLGWANKANNGEGRWDVLFYLGAGLSLLAGIVRAILPESPKFLEQKRLRQLQPASKSPVKSFFTELGMMLKEHWATCIYAVLLMTGFNFFSHSSQDLYPTMLQKAKLLTANQSSIATIISNCGAITGGLCAGYLSQYVGRRLAMLGFIIFAGCMIPVWILPNSFGGLAAGGFLVQVGVQGAWGVIPVYLSEISPSAFRATFPGLAYQLGNMASSASSTIETRGGQNITIKDPKNPGKTIPDYATVSAILLACVAVYLIVLVIFGFERRGDELGIDDHVEGTNAETVLTQAKGRDIEAAHYGSDNNTYINDSQEYEHTNDVHLNNDQSSDKKIQT